MLNTNPYRDTLTGRGYLDVFQRLENYSKTYDNDSRDRNRDVGVTDILDLSGDAEVGSNMRFQGDSLKRDYDVQRYNGTETNYRTMLNLSFQENNGKIHVTQYADDDGDKNAEVHRFTVVDEASGRIEKVVDYTRP